MSTRQERTSEVGHMCDRVTSAAELASMTTAAAVLDLLEGFVDAEEAGELLQPFKGPFRRRRSGASRG